MKRSDIYDLLMTIGEMSGCHQMTERSFFFRGRQFPLCARCTGAFIGYFVGYVCFPFFRLSPYICVAFCAIMFADWFVQRIGLRESTNVRRVVTGAFCGFGLRQLTLELYFFLFELAAEYF